MGRDPIVEEKDIDKTKDKDLRKLVREAKKTQEKEMSTWPFEKLTREVREIFQRVLVFPLHGLFVKLEVKEKRNLAQIKPPAIFIGHDVAEVRQGTFPAVKLA